jgi:hypothetical protein
VSKIPPEFYEIPVVIRERARKAVQQIVLAGRSPSVPKVREIVRRKKGETIANNPSRQRQRRLSPRIRYSRI